MNSAIETVDESAKAQREFLSRVFHLISQPMTALQCSLEFSATEADPEKSQAWLESALENAERLRSRLSLVRDMADSCEPCGLAQSADLRSVLEEALENLQPLLEVAGSLPQVRCGDVQVVGERSRLLRAFLHLYEQLLVKSDSSRQHRPSVLVEQLAERVSVRLLGLGDLSGVDDASETLQVQIARKTFESLGGYLATDARIGICQVCLRAARLQLDLFEPAPAKKPATNVIGNEAAVPQVS